MVEATGVELSSVLTAGKLLNLGTATAAKKAPLPDPLYENAFSLDSRAHDTVTHRIP
jgi:hypothetical protein